MPTLEQALIAAAIGFLAYYFQVPLKVAAKDTKVAAVATVKETAKVVKKTGHVVTHVVTHPIGKK